MYVPFCKTIDDVTFQFSLRHHFWQRLKKTSEHNHSERVSSSTSSFLAHCLAYVSHASMIISKFWCHENETGSLNFGPLRKRSLSFSFCTVLRSPVTTWPHGAYRNSEPWQVQGRGFWERLLKSICCRLLLQLNILEETERA